MAKATYIQTFDEFNDAIVEKEIEEKFKAIDPEDVRELPEHVRAMYSLASNAFSLFPVDRAGSARGLGIVAMGLVVAQVEQYREIQRIRDEFRMDLLGASPLSGEVISSTRRRCTSAGPAVSI